MFKHDVNRRKFINTISSSAILAFFSGPAHAAGELTPIETKRKNEADVRWKAGVGKRIITPETDVWLAGYGTKRVPEGKIHDIWVKVLALESLEGERLVIATTDHMGMSRTIYERIYSRLHNQFGLDRSEFMLTFSHNHCAPCLEDDLVDYYPSDDEQRRLVKEYTGWMEIKVIEAVEEALRTLQPVTMQIGEGICGFAVNRRDNIETEVPKMLAEGRPLKGVVDHYVPVLAVKTLEGNMLGILFGYACHPTTLNINLWNGDYPGYSQINLEQKYPGATAMFFNACGGDQNPIPRRKVELCERYGKMLSDAVIDVLGKRMEPVSAGLKTSFRFVNLPYDEMITREKLLPIAQGTKPVQARWASRMLKMMDEGVKFPTSYEYPVQASQIGQLLFIAIGGESVVDYSLRFKKEFPGPTWVCGYTNDMAAYIPSRRVWEERGYEGGSHLDEYGRPAWRWEGKIETRIAKTVHKVVKKVHKKSKVKNSL
jgi:neutral ceramidase